MKNKILLFLGIFIFLITACSMSSTPTNSVKELLSKYISNDEEIVMELDDYINDSDLNSKQATKYKDAYLKQFKDLEYVIKEEIIDGNTAKVITEITVYDYYNAEIIANNYLEQNPDMFKTNGEYDSSLFTDYKLDLINKVNDRIDYVIEFNLNKINNKWIVNDLTNEQLEKIHGVYKYE